MNRTFNQNINSISLYHWAIEALGKKIFIQKSLGNLILYNIDIFILLFLNKRLCIYYLLGIVNIY